MSGGSSGTLLGELEGIGVYPVLLPPSTGRTAPVMEAAPGEQRERYIGSSDEARAMDRPKVVPVTANIGPTFVSSVLAGAKGLR